MFLNSIHYVLRNYLHLRYCIKNSKDGTYTNGISRLMYGDVEALKDSTIRPPIFGALIHFSLDTQVSLKIFGV